METGMDFQPHIRIWGGTPPFLLGRAALPRVSAAPPAYTFGWDTVFAIRISDVNPQMRQSGACPEAFQAEIPNLCAAEGRFAPWRIVVGEDGGDQEILRLAIPVVAGTLVFQNTTYDLAGSEALVDVQLQYVPAAEV